jgi:outer membrane protein assembly factor BamB
MARSLDPKSNLTFRVSSLGRPRSLPILLLTLCLWATTLQAEPWPSWRGSQQSGVSAETGLVSSWTENGTGQLWKADFIGRSTPVVFADRVCVVGRTGDGVTKQEVTACFAVDSGELLWEHRFNVFHTTIPFNRVGWASPAADLETGNLYVHGVQGLLLCYDKSGTVLWEHSLTEEYGRISGYGGRVHTPVVVDDLVVISYLNRSWGDHKVPRHRYVAFEKNSGDVVWISTPGGKPLDTTYSTPVIAEIAGERLLIGGNADGGIYALQAATGEPVWSFSLSKRGLNTSVVVEGHRVYATHSEENVDNTVMGRVVCIDATGSGDVTATNELWRLDGCLVGYASPAIRGDRLYVIDNGSNLHSIDAANGQRQWTHSIATVGRGSPVWADGKLFVTEVNGGVQILEPGTDGCRVLDADQILRADGGPAEIFGSPAVADGRVYIATEAGLFCLAATTQETSSRGPTPAAQNLAGGLPAHIQIVPAEILANPGDTIEFDVRAFDTSGRPLAALGSESGKVAWSMQGLQGDIRPHEILGSAVFASDVGSGPQVGTVTASYGTLTTKARVRFVSRSSWSEDFEALDASEGNNRPPAHWLGAGGKFVVRQLEDGNKVLVKTLAKRGLQRSNIFFGEPDMTNYAIQADLMGKQLKRNRPDMGLIANRYTLDMMGNHQWLQIRSWASDLRMAVQVPFEWQADEWYRMKMAVEVDEAKAVVRGKVWKRDEAEPESWTISAEDPLPNRHGSPGFYGYSAAEIYYDNFVVTVQGEER